MRDRMLMTAMAQVKGVIAASPSPDEAALVETSYLLISGDIARTRDGGVEPESMKFREAVQVNHAADRRSTSFSRTNSFTCG
jgi:hypothetical protein